MLQSTYQLLVGINNAKNLFSFFIVVVVSEVNFFLPLVLVFEDGHQRGGDHEDAAPEVEEVGEGEHVVALECHVEHVTQEVTSGLKKRNDS